MLAKRPSRSPDLKKPPSLVNRACCHLESLHSLGACLESRRGRWAGCLPHTPRVQSLLSPPPESTAASSRALRGPTRRSCEGHAPGACSGVWVASPQLPQPSLLLPTAARLRHRCQRLLKAECCCRRPHSLAPSEGTRAGPAQKAGDRPVGSDAIITITAANTTYRYRGYRRTFLCQQPETHSIDRVPTVRIRRLRPRGKSLASGHQAGEAVLGFERTWCGARAPPQDGPSMGAPRGCSGGRTHGLQRAPGESYHQPLS